MLKRNWYRILFSILCTFIFVSTAMAHEVSISQQMKVGNGTELQPGTYRVEVMKDQDAAKVRFFRSGDLVVTVPVTLTAETEKCQATEVHSDEVNGQQVITKIKLQGSNESLVFSHDAPQAN